MITVSLKFIKKLAPMISILVLSKFAYSSIIVLCIALVFSMSSNYDVSVGSPLVNLS